MLDEHGLAHAAPRDERDDGGVRLGEGEVEEGKFLFAADEFFLAQARAASKREFVKIVANVALATRSTECGIFYLGDAA